MIPLINLRGNFNKATVLPFSFLNKQNLHAELENSQMVNVRFNMASKYFSHFFLLLERQHFEIYCDKNCRTISLPSTVLIVPAGFNLTFFSKIGSIELQRILYLPQNAFQFEICLFILLKLFYCRKDNQISQFCPRNWFLAFKVWLV